MGHYSIIPQAEVRDSFGFTPPVSGLARMNYHIGAPYLTRNLIRGGASAAQMGAPEFLTGYTRYEGLTDGIRTDITLAPGEAISLCGVVKTTDSNPNSTIPMFMSTWNSGTPPAGFFLGARNDGIRIYAVLDNMGASLDAFITSVSNQLAWQFVAATIDNRVAGTTTLRIVNKTAGTATSQSWAYDLMPCTRVVHVGRGHSTVQTGVADIAMDAVKTGVLTDAEITAIYERSKIACALDGITI